ncbi:uncharacterized protein LOC143045886 [Mytilus galloprovincialis]|uniref:uncharacterized protein LOC143045886 n=1 Tax=Mytilus galloprovincialis TaxID=29158 RepID=UPI003F7BFC62
MKAKSFTEKRKKKTEGTENIELKSELAMKRRRKHRAGKYSINEEVNVSDAEDYIVTCIEDGETVLDVQCGTNTATLTLDKLWQGSKGPCIHFQGSWLTPNEFQYVSGRETAKDWKRSIRHQGKSIKLLLSKGYMKVTTDSGNNESKTVQCKEVKTKRRGKGRRRKAKSVVNQPVLVDIPGHLNEIHISENDIDNKHDVGKDVESKVSPDYTDESHDGNETDETIENYYSENEFQKENANATIAKDSCNEKSINNFTENKQDDNIGSEFIQNKESEDKNCDNSEKSSGKINKRYRDSGYSDQTESEFQTTENAGKDNTIKLRESNVDADIPDINHHNGLSEKQHGEVPEQLVLCDGAQSISKTLMESSHDDSNVTGQKVEMNKTEEFSHCADGVESPQQRMDCDSDAMPDGVCQQPENITGPRPIDQDLYSSDDEEPPTLEPQIIGFQAKQTILPASPSQSLTPLHVTKDLDSTVDDTGVPPSKRIVLALPLKNVCQMSRQDSDTKITLQEPKQHTSFTEDNHQEPQQQTNFSKDSQKESNHYNHCEHEQKDDVVNATDPELISDNSSKTIDSVVSVSTDNKDIKDVMDSNPTKVPNKRKRKRSTKHVKKVDTILNNIPTVTGPKIDSEKDTDNNFCQQKKRKIDKISNKEMSKDCNRKSNDARAFCQQDNTVQQKIKTNLLKKKEPTSIKEESSMKTPIANMENRLDSRMDTSKNQINKDPNLTLTISTKDDKNSLINLSATVPRMNGDPRTRSPLQNSYDDYMRRLEASHSSTSWNPYFPFFQLPRHLEGMSIPTSSFMSPYPPLLGPARKPDHESYPRSLITPTSSPMLSPYLATSPPSFDIQKLPTVPNMWNGKDSFPDPKYFHEKSIDSKCTSSSTDTTSSCLTIKPAHSVMPDSLCSNMKLSSNEWDTPLDLSMKKTKYHHLKNSTFTDLNKNKITNYKNNRNDRVNNPETVSKHKKLKNVWINKTDSEKQKLSIPEKCSCFKDNLEHWSVDQVYSFIKRLDGCSPYSEKFRQHNVTGMSLQFLSTDHMTRGMGMKVGPAIVLSDAITREVQNSRKRSMSCYHCSSKLLRDDHKLFV